ncbi:hypothetical protein GCM10009555_032260 [Acrocarpospora macrocephala]|uniref:Methyltransferase n=2 Tax=Acrocarpospora macrocephala TaxID=150177 RepID=A0A5M3X2P8_9ACTN|nr:hypothetical protein Amac_061550 [Acrocarpospora macrocephala]
MGSPREVEHTQSDGTVPGHGEGHNPALNRLAELQERYRKLESRLSRRSQWSESFVGRELRMNTFREDNCYVWQTRYFGEDQVLKYPLYAAYIAKSDTQGLLGVLSEDGAFGCERFYSDRFGWVSRDLLDSLNEIYFLDRHMDIFGREDLVVVDIGAGYGRLAHRMAEAVPGLNKYYCLDGIPESTLVCETYLRFREVERKAVALALDELHVVSDSRRPDLAVNIHSFSEMPYTAVDGWLSWLRDLGVPFLLIVPNDSDKPFSCEAIVDGIAVRRPLEPLLKSYGYRLTSCEPIILDDKVRELLAATNYFMLFELRE